MKLSAGSRSFLRYGYGDLLREDRKWGVLHRIWPGTQRLLLWGDPVTAAAHSPRLQLLRQRRRGDHGAALLQGPPRLGHRRRIAAAYADASLAPRWDWEKYEYGYRVWGRLLYNPDADPDVWRRYLTIALRRGAARR